MMRSRWSKWLSGVGGVVLIGGLVLANYGGGVTPVEAHHRYQNPFKQILSKLNLILEKLDAGGGGTPSPSPGGGAGNQSLRWDTNNPSTSRFTVLADFGDAAVRDNNTGLVWEQSPSTSMPVMWGEARLECVKKTVGGTTGWRLPSVVELMSVQDGSTTAPFVPASVFTISTGGTPGVQLANYWSATTSSHPNAMVASQFTINSSLVVGFQQGGSVETLDKTFPAQVCVRGPMTESVY